LNQAVGVFSLVFYALIIGNVSKFTAVTSSGAVLTFSVDDPTTEADFLAVFPSAVRVSDIT
jgi:hypothetical protein